MATDVLLFDLGGVLVELGGLPIRSKWLGVDIDPEESWRRWLKSESASLFETGQISADTFAQRIVEEMALKIEPDEFLDAFHAWPVGLYPGVLELLESLAPRYTLALFSNSNELHWPRKMGEMALDGKFQHYFASHLMGLAKPDAAAFEYVLAALAVSPERILFMDDNAMNIDAASAAGMLAHRVSGIDGVKACLSAEGIAI
jgi:putative hydrolase of the HAD superfamily